MFPLLYILFLCVSRDVCASYGVQQLVQTSPAPQYTARTDTHL